MIRREGRERSAAAAVPGAALLAFVLLAGCSRSPGTVEGRATLDGSPARGAQVLLFLRAGGERTGRPFAAGAAGEDGTFRIEVPPGEYHLVARGTFAEGGRERVFKGEYGGNPVRVTSGGRAAGIAIALAPMDAAGFAPRTGTGVAGRVTLGGRPARGAHVYAYPEEAGTVRGPAYVASARTGPDGRFALALREGEYRIVVRVKGGDDETGAMGSRGASGGFGSTSLILGAGQTRELGTIALHAPREESRRLRAASGGQDEAAARVRGTVVRDDGSPVAGVLVMGYADPRMIGRPFAISGRTGAGGTFVLGFPRAGTYYIGARSERGGPVSPGEWVGSYDGSPDHSLALAAGEVREGITIRVTEKW